MQQSSGTSADTPSPEAQPCDPQQPGGGAVADSIFDLAGVGPDSSEPLLAKLLAHLTPRQVLIGADARFDKLTQEQIAAKHGISQPTVCRELAAVADTLKALKIPEPAEQKPDTRHVRFIKPKLFASL